MPKLYEIIAEMQDVEQQLMDAGVDDETLKDTLDSLDAKLSLEEKLEGYTALYKNLKSDFEAYKAEEKKLKEKKQQAERSMEWVKSQIDAGMKAGKMKKLDSGVHKLSYRKGSEVLDIKDDANIPKDFLEPQEPKVLKAELKKWVKEGNKAEGIELKRNPSTIQIK